MKQDLKKILPIILPISELAGTVSIIMYYLYKLYIQFKKKICFFKFAISNWTSANISCVTKLTYFTVPILGNIFKAWQKNMQQEQASN